MVIISSRRLLFEGALQETDRKLAMATFDPAEAIQEELDSKDLHIHTQSMELVKSSKASYNT
jgi:hypothetical protein